MSLSDAYVALRDLLRARLMSPATRESAERAINEVEMEARTESMRTVKDSVQPPKAA